MSQPNQNPAMRKESSAWTSTAFMVEVLVLLFFLIASMAIFTQLFASSITTSADANRLSQATVLAQNAAEEFSANPAAVASGKKIGAGTAADGSDDLGVTCDVTSKKTATGTLYEAHITVTDEDDSIYELDATRYVEGGTK